MSTEPFLSKDHLLDLIKGQTRVEAELANLIRLQEETRSDIKKMGVETQSKVDKLEVRVKALEDESIRSRAYAAVGGSAAGVGMSFLIPFVKSKLGL